MDRLERLADLVAVLLDTRRLLGVDEILDSVPGYPPDRESARRQFERDKDALREAGIPLTAQPVDELGGGDFGYRIKPDDYYLPDLALTPEEQNALHVAVTAVRFEGGDALEALFKLGGLEGTGASPLAALPTVPALADLFEAYQSRATTEFTYRGEPRRVDPWGIVFRRGKWYMVGFDHDREESRSFRADRISGAVTLGDPGGFQAPEGVDPAALLGDEPWRFGDEEPVTARVLLDPTVAAEVDPENVVETRPDGSVVVEIEVTNREAFRAMVMGFLDRAEVLGPPALRADTVAWLEAIVADAP